MGIRLWTAATLRKIADALAPPNAAGPVRRVGARPGPAQQSTRNSVGAFLKKLFRRMLIWFVSLCVAFYVPLSESGIPVHLAAWENDILKANRFPDVFLATVAMVVLSASDLVDNILSQREQRDTITVGSAWTFMVVYFLFVFFGMPAFAKAAHPETAPWGVLAGLLLVGIFGEIIIATTRD